MSKTINNLMKVIPKTRRENYIWYLHKQKSSVKSIRKCTKSLYNHLKPYFFKKLLWSHFWLFVYSLCCYEWFLFVHNLNTTTKFDFDFPIYICPENDTLINLWWNSFLLSKRTHTPKVFWSVKKNPYIINQNHIFSKNYCEVISG
jgi:hypothetical protein